jgi:hypothetical protein
MTRLAPPLFRSLAALLIGSLAATAFGHGVQIQLTYDTTNHKIVTRQIVSTNALPTTVTDLTRIFVMPFEVSPGSTPTPALQAAWYSHPEITDYPSGNGIAYQWDLSAPSGGQLAGTGWSWKLSGTMPNLAGKAFRYDFTDQLLKWNGSEFTAAASGTIQLQAFRGDATTEPTVVATTASGTFLQYTNVNSLNQSGNPHSNAGFRLLSGTSFAPSAFDSSSDGIYLQPLVVSSNAIDPVTTGTVGASDTIYMLMYKNTAFGDVYDVASTFATANGIPLTQIQAVPEPGTVALLGAAATVAAGYIRRRILRRRASRPEA